MPSGLASCKQTSAASAMTAVYARYTPRTSPATLPEETADPAAVRIRQGRSIRSGTVVSRGTPAREGHRVARRIQAPADYLRGWNESVTDPPPGFYEALSIGEDPVERALFWPSAEMILKQDPKAPATVRTPQPVRTGGISWRTWPWLSSRSLSAAATRPYLMHAQTSDLTNQYYARREALSRITTA